MSKRKPVLPRLSGWLGQPATDEDFVKGMVRAELRAAESVIRAAGRLRDAEGWEQKAWNRLGRALARLDRLTGGKR